MNQMEPVSNKQDSLISDTRMRMIQPMSNCAASQQFVDYQMGQVEPMSNDHGSLVLNENTLQMEPKLMDVGSQQLLMPDQQGGMEALANISGPPKSLLPSKRRNSMSNTSVSEEVPIPNKRITQKPLSTAPVFHQSSALYTKTLPMHSMSKTPLMSDSTAQNKRMVRNESLHHKSGPHKSQTPKNRTAPMEPYPKVQTGSFESVRSKMRESIAAALASVSKPHDKGPNKKKSEVESTQLTQNVLQPAKSISTPDAAADYVAKNYTAILSSKECSEDALVKESMGSSAKTWDCDNILAADDVLFSDNLFVRDDFLQGNGLSWVVDFDMEVAKSNEGEIARKPELIHEDRGGNGEEKALQTPQKLAMLIEAELFKLFGGVNKKYKEKGRSLLFNLKDCNNPELRQRVVFGEISPEKLCSMTAEELASKELSQWRMAKAEELAQMVVLPESDVDLRRLVRKTHKGEFQVEVEQDDGVSVEVSVGTSSLTPSPAINKETKAQPPSNSEGTEDTENVVDYKSGSGTQDLPCSLTIPSDGTDLMQGLMMDESSDLSYLPPIVSLDEFMESLDSEPPFENLPVGGGKKPQIKRESMDSGNELLTNFKVPVSPTPDKTRIKAETDKINVKYIELNGRLNSRESHIGPKTYPPGGECIWEGVLKLNIISMLSVFGFFRSGERTSTKEWPHTLETKGKVRFLAFKNFLTELPKSRSRAVMLAQFVLKEGASLKERESLKKVVESYISEDRAGYAEAAPGIELYICPPISPILDILQNFHLFRPLKSTDNSLIGIVIWRRAHSTTTISPPNSSSHLKHSPHNQPFVPGTQPGRDTNLNFESKPAHLKTQPPDEDDDIPPGFGPGADEDDLPEFNFSSSLMQTTPKIPNQNPLQVSGTTSSRGMDRVRELIQKYGQPGSVAHDNDNDNDDDDDDIPEWRPPGLQQQPPPRHGFGNQQFGPAVAQQLRSRLPAPAATHLHTLQPSVGTMQGAWWAGRPGPHGLQPNPVGSRARLGQHYGVPVVRAGQSGVWRQGAPKSRAF